LKKNGQVAEADVTMSDIDNKVLITFYVEDNTSQSKGWIFNFDSTVHICSHKDMLTSWL